MKEIPIQNLFVHKGSGNFSVEAQDILPSKGVNFEIKSALTLHTYEKNLTFYTN